MKSYEELLAERDAFAAQSLRMAEFIRLSAKKWEWTPEVEPTFWNLLRVANVANETPQQYLAEIKAEAGRAGFVAGANWLYVSQLEFDVVEDQKVDAADKYAAKVRQGEQSGTWLKDSNVNGGKRQGGE